MNKTRQHQAIVIAWAFSMLGICHLGAAENLADLLPMQHGYVVGTCDYGAMRNGTPTPGNPVVAIFNTSGVPTSGVTRTAPFPDPGYASASFGWQCFHNETDLQNPNIDSTTEVWNGINLGQIFGVTLDDNDPPNIFVSATSVYTWSKREPDLPTRWPTGETGGSVYRLDGTTGEITTCARLPMNSNASLGNICFHRDAAGDGWLYVSNFEDGFIYRVSEACDLNEDYLKYEHSGPGVPFDDSTSGFTQFGRRIWGVEVHDERLFYGLWNAPTVNQEVWSVGLLPDGAFDASSLVNETANAMPPGIPAYPQPAENFDHRSHPVADIEFSGDGTMFLAERYHRLGSAPLGDLKARAHRARLLEYTGTSGSYIPSLDTKYKVGSVHDKTNSTGGVAVDCIGNLWATGNGLNYFDPPETHRVYGMQWIPAGGNTDADPVYADGYLVDFNNEFSSYDDKNEIGEIEIYRPPCSCLGVTIHEIECPIPRDDPFEVRFDMTNLSEQVGAYWMVTPCLPADLPNGAVTLAATMPIEVLDNPLNPGDSASGQFQLDRVFEGEKVCFLLTLLDATGAECCTEKVCIDVPICECFVVQEKTVECQEQPDGSFKHVLHVTLANLELWDIHHISILPISPSAFAPIRTTPIGGPIASDGGIGSFSVVLEGQDGETLCFHIVAHAEDIETCCSKECCVTLPICDPTARADKCTVSGRAACCPGTEQAQVILTIFNNSAVEKTYDWTITSTEACDVVLPEAAYSLPGGMVTVPAHSHQGVGIMVDCASLAPGECAAFEACVQNSGITQCCRGEVYKPLPLQITAKWAFSGDYSDSTSEVLLPGMRIETVFALENPNAEVVSTMLTISDPFQVLRFDADGLDSDEFGVLRVPVTLNAGEQRDLNLGITTGPGFEVLPLACFTTVDIFGHDIWLANATILIGDLPGPVPPPPAIADVRLVTDPSSIDLDIPTLSGRRYQIQKSPDLVPGNWADTPCEIAGIQIEPDGSFIGTGGIITCQLPCDFASVMMFYRVVRTD